MGLDMYLEKRTFVGKTKIKIESNGYEWYKNQDKEYDNVNEIIQEVGYWRKANAIHKWFVDSCQNGKDDCDEYFVSIEKLEELLALCKKVKEVAVIKKGKVVNGTKMTEDGKWVDILEDGEYIENAEEIEKLLPTQEGFFFGSTAYDQWYMQDIDLTIKILEDALKDKDAMFYYHSSW